MDGQVKPNELFEMIGRLYVSQEYYKTQLQSLSTLTSKLMNENDKLKKDQECKQTTSE